MIGGHWNTSLLHVSGWQNAPCLDFLLYVPSIYRNIQDGIIINIIDPANVYANIILEPVRCFVNSFRFFHPFSKVLISSEMHAIMYAKYGMPNKINPMQNAFPLFVSGTFRPYPIVVAIIIGVINTVSHRYNYSSYLTYCACKEKCIIKAPFGFALDPQVQIIGCAKVCHPPKYVSQHSPFDVNHLIIKLCMHSRITLQLWKVWINWTSVTNSYL